MLGSYGQPVRHLAFSRNGLRLVAGGDDGAVVVWNVGVEWWLHEACTIADDRGLTVDDGSGAAAAGLRAAASDLAGVCARER